MGNVVKISDQNEQDALQKGKIAIGIKDKNYGPSEETGYYAGVTPPENGYVFYKDRGDGVLTIYVANNDTELVKIAQELGVTGNTDTEILQNLSANEELAVLDKEPEDVITDGLKINIDSSLFPSYPKTGDIIYDLSGEKNDGILYNSPTFTANTINFDNTNDFLQFNITDEYYDSWTIDTWIIIENFSDNMRSKTIFSHNEISNGVTNLESNLGFSVGLFDDRNCIFIDENDTIYIGGQYGGFQSHISGFITKIDSGGTVDQNFVFTRPNGSVYNVVQIDKKNNGDLIFGGTNFGQLGIAFINPDTGNITGAPLSANNDIIDGGFILNETDDVLWVYGSYSSNYNNQTISGILKLHSSTYLPYSGFNTTTGFNNISGPRAAVICSDGNIVVVGNFTSYKGVTANRIVKINSNDGSIDTSFSAGTGFNSIVYKIKKDSNNHLIAVGNYSYYNGNYRSRIVKIDENGILVDNFNSSASFNLSVTDLLIESDDSFICVGSFTNVNGTNKRYLAKLNSNGTLDNTFYSGDSFNNSISRIAKQSTGKYILTGNFENYGNTYIGRGLSRINTDGTLDTSFNHNLGFNIGIYRSQFDVRVENGQYYFMATGMFGFNAGRSLFQDGPAQWNNKVHNLTITYSAGTYNLYYNGEKTFTRTLNNTISRLVPERFYFAEKMLKLMVYDKPLSDEEVKFNYDNLKTRLNSLIGDQ